MNVKGEGPLSTAPALAASGKRVDRDLFEAIMRELNNLPGILGVTMVSTEGKIMGSRLTEQLPQKSLVATGSDMMDMLAKILSDYRFGVPKALLIEGEDGRIAVVNAGPNIRYMVIAGTPELNVGLAGIVLQDVLDRFR
jgi:predicted regulator of Ras-like GTPase activity (Roadblock/LC7/MglB family)